MTLQSAAQNIKPTESQVRKLEQVHKVQFADLVSAIDFWHRSRDMANVTPASREAYGKKLLPLIKKWQARENKIKGRVASADMMKGYFPVWWWFDKNHYAKLVQLRNSIDRDTTTAGVGFIPLIIWAVIAIVAAFTAVEIVDETNNTADEQATLIAETDSFCQTNNLTPEQCNKLLTEQTSAAGGDSGFSFGKILLWGALGFAAFKYGLPYLMKDGKKAS